MFRCWVCAIFTVQEAEKERKMVTNLMMVLSKPPGGVFIYLKVSVGSCYVADLVPASVFFSLNLSI